MTLGGLTVLEFDNGRFMNHSEQPNTNFRDPDTGCAIRDIAAGEEIIGNYAEFDPSFGDAARPALLRCLIALLLADLSAGTKGRIVRSIDDP